MPAWAADETPGVVVNPGRYSPYYHLRFVLTPAAIDFTATDRTAGPGGQFAVRVRTERFPVPAPRCRGALILRMPWTSPNVPEARQKVAAKERLLGRISSLERNPDASVPVVLELNPYVDVVSRTPLRLRLTQCNVFFRHARGAYIDNTDPR